MDIAQLFIAGRALLVARDGRFDFSVSKISLGPLPVDSLPVVKLSSGVSAGGYALMNYQGPKIPSPRDLASSTERRPLLVQPVRHHIPGLV